MNTPVLTATSTVDLKQINVFLSDNEDPRHVVINIHITSLSTLQNTSSQLCSFDATFRTGHSQRWVIKSLPPIPCRSAIPILCSRAPVFTSSPRQNIYDTIILPLGDGSDPQLVTIGRRQYPFSLSTKLSKSYRSSLKPIKFVDPVGPRFTTVYANGESMRFSAAIYIRHELTQRCLEALSDILNENAFIEFKVELLSELQALPSCQRDDPDAVWNVFEETLTCMSGLQGERHTFSTMGRIVQNSALSVDAITRRLAARLKSKEVHLSSPSEYQQASFKTSIYQSLPGILLSLHLIAQDFRLSLSRRKDLSRVVKLIIKFALQIGNRDWVDYWERIMPVEIPNHVRVRGMEDFQIY